MKRTILSIIGVLLLSGSLMAQVENERPQGQRPPMGHRPPGRPGGMGRPGGPGHRNQNITYSGATELKEAATETSKIYQSSKTDENALLISTKETVTIAQPTINKTGNSDGGDNCSFYGVNAALLVKGGCYPVRYAHGCRRNQGAVRWPPRRC